MKAAVSCALYKSKCSHKNSGGFFFVCMTATSRDVEVHGSITCHLLTFTMLKFYGNKIKVKTNMPSFIHQHKLYINPELHKSRSE